MARVTDLQRIKINVQKHCTPVNLRVSAEVVVLEAEHSGDGEQRESVGDSQLLSAGIHWLAMLQLFVDGTHQPQHADAVDEPTDAEKTQREEIQEAPTITFQVEVVES